MVYSILGIHHTERHGHSGAMSVEGRQTGQTAGPHGIQGEAARVGLVQPVEDSIFSYGSTILSTEDPRNCISSAVGNKSQDMLCLPVGQTFEKHLG